MTKYRLPRWKTGRLLHTPALPSACKMVAFTVRGRVKNARTGSSLSGVKVTVSSNNVVSSWGFFTMRNVPAGTVTLKYEKSGYITTEKELTISGNVNSGGVADVSMSPAMAQDQWRAVLKWGRSPSDLDTYGRWGWSKVYWAGKDRTANTITAKLEQDRTSGYGPETLYLSDIGRCTGGASPIAAPLVFWTCWQGATLLARPWLDVPGQRSPHRRRQDFCGVPDYEADSSLPLSNASHCRKGVESHSQVRHR